MDSIAEARPCEMCGRLFRPLTRNVKKGCGKTCSIQCRCDKAGRTPKTIYHGREHKSYKHGWFTGPRSQWNQLPQRAWDIVQNAVRDGRLKRQPCEKCAMPNAEAHHEDYSRPLDVKWLCRRCHMALHSMRRAS